MSVKSIINESISKNPVGLKEALVEELNVRIAARLAERTEEIDEEYRDLDEEFGDLEEADDRMERAMQHSHGPLMKAGKWIPKQPLEKLVQHPELKRDGDQTLYVGHISHAWDPSKPKKAIAILNGGKPDPDSIRSGWRGQTVGYNKPHQWYEDSGMGYKFPSSHLTITGHVHIKPDGTTEKHGDVDMKKSHNLMVYK